MKDHKRHIIYNTESILTGIRMLNEIADALSLTLFVVDPQSMRMVGTVTDGDIRRALARGCGLDCSICEVMNPRFTFIEEGNFDPNILRYIRKMLFKLVPILDAEGHIVRILSFADGHSYVDVSRATGASSTTVSRVSKCLNGPAGGYRLVLSRLG